MEFQKTEEQKKAETVIKMDKIVTNKIIVEASKNKKIIVFLGGTVAESTWREQLIPQLDIDYFDPVVDDWTPECMKEEIRQKKICDYVLYVITPSMKGVYSIAEVVDDSNKRPDKTVFCFLESYDSKDFSKEQIKSLKQVGEMVKDNGGEVCDNLTQVAKFLNRSK